MKELTYEDAHRLFRYDPESGKLYWRVSSGAAKAGAEAGTVFMSSRTHYRKVCVRRKYYLVHRVVWLILHSEWPEGEIDHIDGDGLNNRADNLRDVPVIVNHRNKRMQRNNTSGVNGVCWDKNAGKWKAQSPDGISRNKHIGLFDNICDAEHAVREFQASLGYTNRHGSEECG